MPDWDELVGRTVLLGLTFADAEGNIRARVQRHGVIEVADPASGIGIRFVAPGHPWDRALYWLPPDLRPFADAAPGAYRLRSTGETVVDPDLTSTWEIRDPAPGESTPEQRAARLEEARRYGFPTD
jgi:hypothetical protein